jgi:phospholipid/cholesterol/gamma-HCH transport system permease protein
MVTALKFIGKFPLAFCEDVGTIAIFIWNACKATLRPPFYLSEIIKQAREITYRCLLPVIGVTVPFGMVVALHGIKVFRMFGSEQLLSSLLAVSILRELAPGAASIMIAAQAGTAVTAEIGAMKIKQEFDAAEVMAVNPMKYIIFPRLLGIIVASVIVITLAGVSGIAGGYFVAVILKGANSGYFMSNLFSFLGLVDIYGSIIKAIVFGLVIGSFACYSGFQVQHGAEEVGKATNNTVISSIIANITLNYFLTQMLYRGTAGG